ncbi:MAG: hypothetical protein AMJ90_00245 [candidate division Zixibacteria bacterium SM23_73_2]|nr:MAG: hypothetical protein AMJ90_00245 [candidate division Zixibacteria bacterium SM23_73_2]
MRNPKKTSPRIITLLTDFGIKSGYAGCIKGVISSINPKVQMVDITHQINPFDVWEGCFVLSEFYPYFPEDTIHLVIVDPGVGGPRKALLVRTERYFFIGPDNGVLSYVFEKEKILEIKNITREKYFIGKPSPVFHARDIFAPVAAYLSLGVELGEFGPDAKECFKFKIKLPEILKDEISGEIIHIDSFGNLITNIDKNLVDTFAKKDSFDIVFKGKRIKKISLSYFEGKRNEILALIGSSGLLELSASEGDAQKLLLAKVGDRIKLEHKG